MRSKHIFAAERGGCTEKGKCEVEKDGDAECGSAQHRDGPGVFVRFTTTTKKLSVSVKVVRIVLAAILEGCSR
jgi:hypothetical protein